MTTTEYIAVKKASFISGLTDRELNRVVDEHLLPDELFIQTKGARLFSTLGVALAQFYFKSAEVLSASSRKWIITSAFESMKQDLKTLKVPDAVILGNANWEIELDVVKVDIAPFMRDVWSRLSVLDETEKMIEQDDNVMSGRPVFKGTRLPIDMVVSENGELSEEEALEAYPFLTREKIEAAKLYQRINPSRGRPRRLIEANPGLKMSDRKGDEFTA